MEWYIIAALSAIILCIGIKRWAKRLKTKIRTKRGFLYEKKVARYLRWHGYWNVTVTKASGDSGVDIVARKGLRKYAIQCKHYSNPVGVHAVQEVVAGKKAYGCSKAMVVTNSTFTKAAKELAETNGVILLANVG